MTYSKDKEQKWSSLDELDMSDAYLSSNHSHFLLVDDGTQQKTSRELVFRSRLEEELRRGKTLRYYQKRRLKPNMLKQLHQLSTASEELRHTTLRDWHERTSHPSLHDAEPMMSAAAPDDIPMIMLIVQGEMPHSRWLFVFEAVNIIIFL